MWIRAERVAVLTPTASLRRLTACYAALAVCAALACTTGQPAARAADGREMLAQAIATTRGSYLVYNFGGGHPMPLLNAGGHWYEMNNGGHLMIIKNASQRLSPHLLVDTHTGDQARCEHNPGARTGEGLWQASEIYPPLKAWQRMGRPTIAVNANFFDVRGQRGQLAVDRLQLTAGRLRGQHPRTRTRQPSGHRHRRLRRKAGPFRGNELWSSLTTMILPVGGAPYVLRPKSRQDYDLATPVIEDLLNKNARFVAVAGIGLLSPAIPASSTTAVPAPRERRLPMRSRRTRCTSSRAATTPRTTSKTCSAAWVVTPRFCSTAGVIGDRSAP